MLKQQSRYRVAITGIGVAAPIGINSSDYCNSLVAGTSGIKPITLFNADNLTTRIAAETHLPQDFMPQQSDGKARFMHWAAAEAHKDAFGDTPNSTENGVVSLGIGLDLLSLPRLTELYHAEMQGHNDCDIHLHLPGEAVVFELAQKYQCRHAPHILVSACAASADAIGVAMEEIRNGEALWAIAGGMDSMINPMGFTAFCLLGAMSKCNELGPKASRPFDKNRDGFVMGEGAGAFILENYDHAQKRGAKVYAELIGYGSSLDAYAISDPHPEGQGAAAAMQNAVDDAGLAADKIEYINAHGTSTPKNDIAETIAIKRIFPHLPPVSSTKSMIGHCIAAAGVLEIAAVVLCQQVGFLPPTLNLQEPDIGCDLDYIPGEARAQKCEYFMSNSFAFGGQNTSVIGRIIRE